MTNGSEMQVSALAFQTEIETQIRFVLDHPRVSSWLKEALSGALGRERNSISNDLEILTLILRKYVWMKLDIQAPSSEEGAHI